MDNYQYDIAIIGMGCAGSHVVLALLAHPAMKNKKVVVIDDFQEDSLEKTWSFWEKGLGKWDHLIDYSWQLGSFQTSEVKLDFGMAPYVYKTIESRDFIAFAKAELQKNQDFTYLNARVQEVTEHVETATISTSMVSLQAKTVLDSRMPEAFEKDQTSIKLAQHFLGWTIKTEEPIFDTSRFTMMDYRIMDPGTTSFTYILPFSKHEALVEFTYFSKDVVDQSVYENYLNSYIKDILKIDKFSVEKSEKGVIPMTTYNFDTHHSRIIHKIGTAGGWVKPSTGYSFKRSEKLAQSLVEKLATGKSLNSKSIPKRFKWYDDIMLDVLYQHNDKGHLLFQNLYKNNPIERILAFLDEETHFGQELKIMLPMTSVPFIKSFFKRLFQ